MNEEFGPYQTALERHPEMLKLIGTVSVEATNLDVALGRLFSAVLHIDAHYGSVVYLTPKAAFARLDMLRNAVKESIAKSGTHRAKIDNIIKRAETIIGKRHEAMHVAWSVSAVNVDEIGYFNLPFSRDVGPKDKKIEEMERVVSDTRQLITEVIEFAEVMYAEWPPYTWPEGL